MDEQQVTITEQVALTPAELTDILRLKAVCDEADGLDIKLGYGAPEPDTAPYPVAFLAHAGDTLVGYCSLEGDASVAELSVMVHPDWRRQWVAARLFEEARASFKQAGGERLIAVCEDDSVGGRAFLRMLAAQLAFAEHRMLFHGERAPTQEPHGAALTVARARADEIPALAVALAHAFNADPDRMRPDLEQAMNQPTEQVYIARLNGAIIGGFRLSDLQDATGIYAFGVDPAYQRRGLGRQMLARACALAPAGQRITLEVDTDNVAAIALYRSAGFTITTTYGYYIFSPTLLATGLNVRAIRPNAGQPG